MIITKSIKKQAKDITGSIPVMSIIVDLSIVPASSLEATSNGLTNNGFRRNNQTKNARIPSRSSIPTNGQDFADLLLLAKKLLC